jgi:penicillin-binding protein 1A
MTSAYSVFPNQGVRMVPYSVLKVTDREGQPARENRPDPQDAIRADTAFVMTSLLRGVVEHGTGVKAAALNWPIAGKTGTTDDFSDAWFIGFDPDITLGVWVGYDQKKPLGHGMTGAEARCRSGWTSSRRGSAIARISRSSSRPATSCS